MFGIAPDDGARDRRIDDPSNSWFIHPAGRLLLRPAIRLGIPANAVSVAGFAFGAAAAALDTRWQDWRWTTAAFFLCICWLIADGLDGMIARATGTTSEIGRVLDGLCDHGVFILLYVALAGSIGTASAWLLAVAAGTAHAVQASLFEGERIRFHRRVLGDPGGGPQPPSRNPLVRAYEAVAGSLDRIAAPFDEMLRLSPDPRAAGARYAAEAARPLAAMALLSNNVRVLTIYLACLASDPRLFWWFELIVLTAVAAGGILWHRRVETRQTRTLPTTASLTRT